VADERATNALRETRFAVTASRSLNTPLRIGFDGHAFTSPAGGVRRYAHELARALAELGGGLEIVAVGVPDSSGLPRGVEARAATGWLPTNFGWSIDGLPRAVRKLAVDLFHAPAYTAPLWGVHPLVLTIHDVSYERHPEWYPYAVDPVRRWFYRRSAQTADVVVTDSEFSRLEVEAAYGISRDRLHVVPLGVGRPFQPDGHDHPAASQRPGLPPTILHVGDLHPRRNVGVLLEALALLRARHPDFGTTELVLAGTDRGSIAGLAARAKELSMAAAVRFVAAPEDAAVVRLMQQATVFAYPSLYEGFGLPVLEAMACGVPVIASTAASIPEVVGDAGLLVDPRDVRAWSQALASVLTSPERAGDLRKAGLSRAATFTWSRTAAQTLEVYRSVLGAPRTRGFDRISSREASTRAIGHP
jgi:glycosyltransferase involved in cell wall biosynthesis